MLTINRLKIKGFRAYTDEQSFIFDNPIIFLFGENHFGKSSTLNAIEWCLFGNKECIGTKTGIRERVGWIIPNLSLGNNPEVFVELELKDENNQNYKIFRKWLNNNKDPLKVTLPDGTILEEEEAKKKLDSLLGITFKDYMATVYQHQETIREILIQEPRYRNEAIDRLLGLSDYRNIKEIIEKSINDLRAKKPKVDITNFSKEIDNFKKNLDDIIIEKKEEAYEKGIYKEQIDEIEVLKIADKEVNERLQKFAEEVGFEIPNLSFPDNWRGLKQFRQNAENIINDYRKEMPDVKKQEELFNEYSKAKEMKLKYEFDKENLKVAEKQLKDFSENNGDEKAIKDKIVKIKEQIQEKRKEKKKINAKGTIIGQAIDYLNLDDDRIDKTECPVCGEKKPDLLDYLTKEYETKYKAQLETIDKEIEELNKNLESAKTLLDEYIRIRQDIENKEKVLEDTIQKIGNLLQIEISKEDDPYSLLNSKLKAIETDLEKLKSSVTSKQEKLNKINSSLDKIKLIEELLNYKEREKLVEQIVEKDEYKRMELLDKKIKKLMDDLDTIENAVIKVSNDEAKKKIDAAAKAINSYYCKITRNPLITKINIDVTRDKITSLNSYDFKGGNGEDLIPLLSQGDLNALALSIFLGLSCSEGINSPLNFIILDDPSQSLSSGHKENLVEVLNGILERRMVILSSMDKELQKFLEDNITKYKTKYKFTDWSPEKGPQVVKE